MRPASWADQAKPPQRKLDVLHQRAPPLQRIGGMKKAFMLSVHNEPEAAPCKHRRAWKSPMPRHLTS